MITADTLKAAVELVKASGGDRIEIQCEMFGSHVDLEIMFEDVDIYFFYDGKMYVEAKDGGEIKIPYDNIMEVFTNGQNVCDVRLRS